VATPSTVAVAGGNPDGTGTFTATCSGGTDRAGNLAPPVSVSYTVTGPAARVSVSETGFSPKSLSVQQGSVVLWTFDGTGQQSLVDSTSTGLFGTDAQAPGSAYSFTFFAAGTYPYRDGLHSTLGGTVSVPLTVSPAAGATGTSFTVTWSCQTAPAGYVFDVQIRRPNSRSFVSWRTGVTVGQDTFVPDAGAGTYWFRAQIRNTANGKASKYSPLGTITVS
jgi:plastocyanin